MIKLEQISEPYAVGDRMLVMGSLTIGDFELEGRDSQPELVFTVEAFAELKAALDKP